MNNIKRLFLGIAAIALTLSFSAFKEVKTVAKSSKFATVYYGWNDDDKLYDRIPGTPNTSLNCVSLPDVTCAIQIETDDTTPEDHLTRQEAQDADATAYPGSATGSYFN